jgi:hypothetical protein
MSEPLHPLAGTPFGTVVRGRPGVPAVVLDPVYYAATQRDVNRLHGDGRSGGRLGHDLTTREALRNVTWAWQAAHREQQIAHQRGVGRSLDFAGRLNTLMAGAVHAQLDGTAADPAAAGFLPHTHKVPLAAAHSVIREAASRMGLKTHSDLLAPDQRVPVATSPEVSGHAMAKGNYEGHFSPSKHILAREARPFKAGQTVYSTLHTGEKIPFTITSGEARLFRGDGGTRDVPHVHIKPVGQPSTSFNTGWYPLNALHFEGEPFLQGKWMAKAEPLRKMEALIKRSKNVRNQVRNITPPQADARRAQYARSVGLKPVDDTSDSRFPQAEGNRLPNSSFFAVEHETAHAMMTPPGQTIRQYQDHLSAHADPRKPTPDEEDRLAGRRGACRYPARRERRQPGREPDRPPSRRRPHQVPLQLPHPAGYPQGRRQRVRRERSDGRRRHLRRPRVRLPHQWSPGAERDSP